MSVSNILRFSYGEHENNMSLSQIKYCEDVLKESIIIYKKLLKNNNLANIKIIDLRVSNQVILTKIDE